MTQYLRQRPPINGDNAFFFDALEDGKLVAQQCSTCERFRHPPVPCCPNCQSFAWTAQEISGVGHLLSYTVIHHPIVPPFEQGYIVGLVELEHGIRMVMNLEFHEEHVAIGMPIDVRPHRYDEDLILMAGFIQDRASGSPHLDETQKENKCQHQLK